MLQLGWENKSYKKTAMDIRQSLNMRIWDLIVSVPDHCLSFYFEKDGINVKIQWSPRHANVVVMR